MPLRICPGCKQNVDRDAARCPACGFSLAAAADAVANRSITWFASGCAVVGVGATLAVNFKYDLDFMPIVHEMVAAFVIASLAVYVLLRLATPRSGRRLWLASAGVGILATAGLYSARVLMAQGALPMVSVIADAHFTGQPRAATQPMQTTRPTTGPAGVAAVRPSDSDDYAPMLRAAQDALAKIRQQPDRIRAELTAAGVPKLLAPATVADAKRLAAGRARIKRLYARLDEYDTLIRKTAADVAIKVQLTDAPSSAKLAFLKQFHPTGDRALRAAADFIAFERKSLAQVDALLAFAQGKTGQFTIAGNRVNFSNKTDANTYAVLHRDVTDAYTHEEQLLRSFRQQGDVAMRQLTTALDAQASARD